jgi:flavin reductase (DIM6/NTAB) family NADH-FMN oxidoreductase RutF
VSEVHAAATAALSAIAMPVVVVASADGPERSCATATVMYTSLVPPAIALALHPGSRTAALVRKTGELAVSILAADQLDIAIRAGRSVPGRDKLTAAGIPVLDPPAGFASPGVAGSIAVLWAKVSREVETGDHRLVIAEVIEHRTFEPSGSQLVRVDRRYVALGARLGDDAPDGYPV